MARQTLAIVSRLAAFVCAAVPAVASAQIYGNFLNDIQQQPVSENLEAKAEHAHREAGRNTAPAFASSAKEGDKSNASTSLSESRIPARSDDFAGMNVPTYRLENGVTLQVSGGFRPSDTVRCISNCFVRLQPPH